VFVAQAFVVLAYFRHLTSFSHVFGSIEGRTVGVDFGTLQETPSSPLFTAKIAAAKRDLFKLMDFMNSLLNLPLSILPVA
jgi:hypothetical protein